MSEGSTLDRWKGFVQKVTGRLTEVMNEGNAGFASLLEDKELDPLTFTNAMQALDLRAKDLLTKLGTTWGEQVSVQLGFQNTAAFHEGEALLKSAQDWLETTWARYRTGWNERLVRSLWDRVQASMARPVACVRCGATLQPKIRHQADSVTCPHCHSVNTVTPETLVYTFYAMAPDLYGEARALEARFAVERHRQAWDQQDRSHFARLGIHPHKPIEMLRQWEALERAYWTTYFQSYAQLKPLDERTMADFIESRMRAFYQYTLASEPAWPKG